MRHCLPLGESLDDTDHSPARLHRQLHLVVTRPRHPPLRRGRSGRRRAGTGLARGQSGLGAHRHSDHSSPPRPRRRRRVTEKATDAKVYGPASEKIPGRDVALKDNDRVSVLGLEFQVYAVPGHTLGHIAFYHEGVLFCGDTLFAAGCGRLFEGTPDRCMHP